MEIDRIIDLNDLLRKKSCFLFGPRATGKSTLVHRLLSDSATIIDLLDSRLFLRLSAAPQGLEAISMQDFLKRLWQGEIIPIPPLT